MIELMKDLPPCLCRACLCIVASVFSLSVGCARYEQKPLTTQAVEQSLSVPDAVTIRESAANLKHPLLPPVQIDLQKPLSPDQVAVLAVIVNPSLRAERDRRAVSQAQLLQAGLLPNPQIIGGIDQPVGGPDHFTAYNIGVNWDITSLIGRDERREAAALNAASVELDIAWTEWQIAQAAKSAAYDVIALTDELQQLRAIENQMAANRDLLRRAVEANQKTLTDLAAAEAGAGDAHEAFVTAQGDLRRAQIALNRAIGLPSDAKLTIRSDGIPQQLSPPDPHQLLVDLESRRLDLVALRKGYESQDATLREAVLKQFPKINLGFNTARDTSNVRTIGFGVSVDIPIFDRNQGAIATESATRQKLFDEYASRVFETRNDVTAAVANIESLNAQIAAAQASLPSLESMSRTYQQAMKQGDVDALSLYAAQNALLQKRVDVAKLKQQLMQNWAALEIAAGQTLPLNSATTRPTTIPSSEPRQ